LNSDLLIEIIGASIGLAYFILQYKASIWLWVAGMIMSIFYIFIFFQGKLYANMLLYGYYLIANIYGLWVWFRHSQKTETNNQSVSFSQINGKLVGICVGISAILWLIIAFILRTQTDSPVPVGDSFVAALSIVGMWMMSKKYIEHWFAWILVDTVGVGLYFYQSLYPTAVLFTLYIAGSIFGYFHWRKKLENE